MGHFSVETHAPPWPILMGNQRIESNYQQLVVAGKPAMIVITIVMQKLVVSANALRKAGRCRQHSLA